MEKWEKALQSTKRWGLGRERRGSVCVIGACVLTVTVVLLSVCDVLSIMSPRVSRLVRFAFVSEAKVFMWFWMCAFRWTRSVKSMTSLFVTSLLGFIMGILAGWVAISFICLVWNHDVLYWSCAMRPRCWSTLDFVSRRKYRLAINLC